MTKFRLSIDYHITIGCKFTTLNDKPAVEFDMVKYPSRKGVDTVTIATDILDKCCARVEAALKIIQPGEGIVVHTSGETPVSLVFEKLA